MSNTVTVDTCTKHCVEECPYFEIECNTFYSNMLGHKYYSCTHLNICEKALALKEKEEQEEAKEKSNAEIYVDFLEYLLTSTIAMIEKKIPKVKRTYILSEEEMVLNQLIQM